MPERHEPNTNGVAVTDERAILIRAIGDSIRAQIAEVAERLGQGGQVINVTAQEIALPVPRLTIPPSQIHLPPAQITNEVHSPDVHVTNQVQAPVVNVTNDVSAPLVNVTNEVQAPVVNVTNQVAVPVVNVAVDLAPVARALNGMGQQVVAVLEKLTESLLRLEELLMEPKPRRTVKIQHGDGTSSSLEVGG